mgnify:CR=1 FL=1
MTFNDPAFVQEFSSLVAQLGCSRILEVGARSGELMDAVGADGIDIDPQRPDVPKVDIRDFHPSQPYDLVFSSGVVEHYFGTDAVDFLKAKARVSSQYVLTYAPNTECLAYRNAKAATTAQWADELDYTPDSLATLHEAAGLHVVASGLAGARWAARFGSEPSEPYLSWVLARVV